mgnify:FL=1
MKYFGLICLEEFLRTFHLANYIGESIAQNNTAILITKDNKAFLNFDKPVGAVLLKKIAELMEFVKKGEISLDQEKE